MVVERRDRLDCYGGEQLSEAQAAQARRVIVVDEVRGP